MKVTRDRIVAVLSLYIAFVFVQSLFFKYTNSVETQHIFGTLDLWAAGFGAGGIFGPTGLFSQYVIGTAELVASGGLIKGLVLRNPGIQALSALIAIAIISGAIAFHLFTPLGVVVLGDGGLLFAMACGVWLSAAAIIVLRFAALRALFGGLFSYAMSGLRTA